MNKILFFIFIIIVTPFNSLAQTDLEGLGYRIIELPYQDDTVRVLIKSKAGEEFKPKPIFLFCQGSLPRPLIFENEDKTLTSVAFPFQTPDELLKDFHLIVIAKPSIPVIAPKKNLTDQYLYVINDNVPANYIRKDFLDFYVNRNIYILKTLLKERWTSEEKLIVAGHSQGSTIAIKMADKFEPITHIIYASGNPFGRIMNTIHQVRNSNDPSDERINLIFTHWKKVIENPDKDDNIKGDSYKSDFTFNENQMNFFLKSDKQILVTYGTKDNGSIFNDYLNIEVIRHNKENINFISYPGLEHNFFSVSKDGQINYNEYNWDKVIIDWYNWINKY